MRRPDRPPVGFVLVVALTAVLGATSLLVRAEDLPPPEHVPQGRSLPPAPARPAPAADPFGPVPSGPAAPEAAPAPPAPPVPSSPQVAPPAPPPVEPLPPESASWPVVVRMEFVGNTVYATESVKLRLRLKEGRRLDPSLLDADTATLYQFFSEVRIDQEEVPGGVLLRFTVVENPVVRELVVNGLEEMKEEEILALPIRTKVGYPYVERNVELDREDIAAAYRRRGFHFADVSVGKPVPVPSGGRRVVLTVVEGPKVQVDDLVFRGNLSVRRQDLVDAMLTRPAAAFPMGLFETKVFNEETLREDIVEVRRVLRGEGFLDAEATLEDLRFSDDKSRVVIVIAVEEGERYTVGDVSFDVKRETSGPGAAPPEDTAWFTQERMREILGLPSGQPYSGKAEEKGRERLREEYFRRSYLEARIERAELRPRPTGRVVDLRVPVQEGLKYRVARVQIVGNEYTRDKILRREIAVEPGDFVDRNALDRGLARIRGLRYFDRATQRYDDVVGPDGRDVPDLKDVVYEVVEGKTGKLNVGVALATGGGLSGNVSFTKRNFDIARLPRSWDDLWSGAAFTGAGQTFNVYLQPGTVTSAYGIDFGEPRLFGSKLGGRVGFNYRIANREGYQEDFLGYYARLNYPVLETRDDRWSLDASVQWRHEWVSIGDVDPDAVPGVFLFEGDHELRSLIWGAMLRYVDDPVRPRLRHTTAVAFEHAGGFLGGNLDYWKLTLNHDQKWTLHEDEKGRRHYLSVGVSGGLASAYDETPEVPPFARYFLGGRQTLRGFAHRGVGQHSDGKPMGGEFFLAGTFEYEMPVAEDFLSVVGFCDWGTIGTSLDDDDAWRLRASLGAGLRIKIPMLGDAPLALDLGFPVLREDEDRTQWLSFSLARDF